MTREEAKVYLKRADVTVGRETKTKTAEALEMAIKALEQEPCEDTISREQAIKQCGFGMTSLLVADCLRRLPPVTPKQRTGKWINNHTTCECCGWQMIDDVMESPNIVFFPFCPNCGAKMEGESE